MIVTMTVEGVVANVISCWSNSLVYCVFILKPSQDEDYISGTFHRHRTRLKIIHPYIF